MKGCFVQRKHSWFLINNVCIHSTEWRKCVWKMCTNMCVWSQLLLVHPQDGRETKAVTSSSSEAKHSLLTSSASSSLYCHRAPPSELHLPALFNIRKDPASSVRYFKSHEPSSVTYQTLNHVLGCRPSPPILLILPKPHSFCLLLRLRLKGA